MNFQQLQDEGYQGNDASLEISLFEYGLIWKEDGNDFRFIFGVERKRNEYGEYDFCSFDWGCVAKDTDPKEEWNWVKWEDVFNFCGQDNFSFPLPHIVSDLIAFYGREEIFGSAYHPFSIENE
jgi:hypothetical protein